MKLSDIQRRILFSVVLHAEKSVPEIGRLLGIRDHIVRRTILMFFEKKIFLRRSAYINPHMLGLTLYVVHITLPLISAKSRRKLLEILTSIDEACSVAELGGEGQFEVRLLARNRDHLSEVFEGLALKLPFPFRIHRCLTVLESDYSGTMDRHDPRDPASTLHFGPLPDNSIIYKLDDKDHAVLSALANQNYLSLNEVARSLSMPAASLQYRVERLEKAGVIVGHYYVMDPQVFSEAPIGLQIKSRVLTRKEKESLRVFCRSHPRIAWITFFAGEQSAEIYTLVREHAEAHSVIGDLSVRFGDILESASMIPQLSFAKYSMYPFKNVPSFSKHGL